MRRSFPVERIEQLTDESLGLSSGEVIKRRARYGTNDIIGSPPTGWADLARDTARDPMIWFLVATSALFAVIGDVAEAGILAVALLPIIGMDAYLHRRTQASTEGLAGRLATSATVIRDGRPVNVPAIELVPGDLLSVESGDPFPADGLIVGGRVIQVDESALTGEAMPVRKEPFTGHLPGGEETSVDERHWAAAGTRLLTGDARLRVIYTGGDTLYGQIVRLAQAGRHERTPLQRAIAALVSLLIVAALVICLALAATRYLQGHGLVDALVSAVTLAVAALPEEFPVVFTFFLGVGVYRLARCQALVRRAVVVENVGRVTAICSDKTGTLTEGRLRLAHVLPAASVTSERLIRLAAAASRAESGDPLDLAILEGRQPAPPGEPVAVFPFTEDRRREVAVLRTERGRYLAAAKGAPETIFGMVNLAADQAAGWRSKTEELAASGHKVIACAERELAEWAGGEPDRDFRFLGLLAFEDPVREGVAEAVAQACASGIRVIMITGDHPATARAIARDVGIGGADPKVIDGETLARGMAQNGPEFLPDVDVIARVVPAQKLDVVRALQRMGETVAVTGDGVNDVPALQGADIGIAMGERGTRTAREVASIVLLDDNFRTIVAAIAEGRQLFRNLKRSFAYLLMIHMPLVVTAAAIPFAGYPLLYLPVHVVWLELIIHPTALLAFQETAPPRALARAKGRVSRGFFNPWEWTITAVVGTVVTAVVTAGYLRSLGSTNDVLHARTMALVVLIMASISVTVALTRLKTHAAIVIAACAAGSAILLVQIPASAAALRLTPLHVDDWLIAAVGGLLAGSLSYLMSRPPNPLS